MSDLSATACGCNNSCSNNGGCGSLLWIIILSSLCGGGFGNSGCNDGCGGNNLLGGGMDICTLLILCTLCGGLGNNSGCGNSGCGCGC